MGPTPNRQLHDGVNFDGSENYVALEATGGGQMAGLLLEVNKSRAVGTAKATTWCSSTAKPGRLRSTGPGRRRYSAPGLSNQRVRGPVSRVPPDRNRRPTHAGLVGAYRWFVHDPIRFTSSIRWTVEHGHANNFANEYASVAYWYQGEPHAPFPQFPERDDVRPPLPAIYDEAREAYFGALRDSMRHFPDPAPLYGVAALGELYYAGRFEKVLERLCASD